MTGRSLGPSIGAGESGLDWLVYYIRKEEGLMASSAAHFSSVSQCVQLCRKHRATMFAVIFLSTFTVKGGIVL